MPYVPHTWTSREAITTDKLNHIEQGIADLYYQAIQISSFSVTTPSGAKAEIGSTVSAVTLAYAMNKVPASATLDGAAQTISAASGTIGLTGLSLTANKTWTLAVTDEKGATASKTATLSFLNKAYWGAAAAGTVNSAFILALSNSELTATKARTLNVTAGAGKYIWYAVPSSFGACSFAVNGFTGGFSKVSTFTLTNASGAEASYDVYRSDNAALGETTVTVS